ncbi:glutamate receptor 2.7 [Morus notabilis]|nr:glutamate receptor 2.7 [Morus notabilis]
MFSAMAQNNSTTEVNVGVILNLDTGVGKVGLSCLKMALSDFYNSRSFYNTRLVLHVRDSNKDVVKAASAALDLMNNEKVEAIIGPQTSMQANFVINLGGQAHVPIISFSATSPALSSLRSPYFFQATQNDSSQVNPITALVQAFGWRQVVPIYVDNYYGESFIPYLTDALQNVDVRVPYRSAVPPRATDEQIASELYKLMTMQSRVFVVHMLPHLGSRLFAKAEEIGLMEKGCVWIVTNGLAELLNSTVVGSMQGVLGVKTHVGRRKELESFRVRWKRQFQRENPGVVDAPELNVFGLWAYDAAFALAMAVEKVGGRNGNGYASSGFVHYDSENSSTQLDTFGVSRNGRKLRDELLAIRFRGLTGEFSMVSGQLQSSTFEVVNVNGNGERLVGFWSPQSGLTRKLNVAANASVVYLTSESNLGPVIWPGDSLSVPKGWVAPTNGKKLRVGVPVKSGNSSFVKLIKDPSTNRTQFTGFCIEVFNAVIDQMPCAVPFDFIPFSKPNGESAGSYNDMIYQVYLGNFDAVAADMTIIANRSLYVDFTLPYTDSGVTMIVPIKSMEMKNAWVFLKPWTWELWVTTCCFFLFVGFVVWLLEHRINNDFRGPPSHQVGTSFWFSFSTMVFAHREQVVSNMARIVLIIWCFVVLVLTQSYTASLTSLLTVQQLRPTLTNVNELLKNKVNVGFPNGSFVLEMLREFVPLEPSQIKVYKSLQHLGELFENGDIEAAFDEIPYVKLFIAKHCSNYAMVGPIYKTAGFGFAFPRGSPLVRDVSRAILNVTEGNKMKEIENAWFTSATACPDSSAAASSASLGLNSFWGLFLIAGSASLSTLTIFVAMFLYKHRKIWTRFDPEVSLWQKIRMVSKIFDEKDLSSHTFRKNSELQNRSPNHVIDVVNGSPNNNFPPSPSSCSNQTEFNFTAHEEPGRPSST